MSAVAEQRTLALSDVSYDLWHVVKDGHHAGLRLYERHYSAYRYADGRGRKRFTGPGERIVLVTRCGAALFVWRLFRSLDVRQNEADGRGLNCSIFRNESRHLSSELILQAEARAWARWPGRRLYTYVNPGAIRSSNPGCCFKKAGWQRCGTDSDGDLLIFEKLPSPLP
jgi:hypothetical protein